jgi:adenine-specific DNA-methyltransferase
MPTTQQLRDRLMKKLKELFQLDQPDLDFGFYRIMHAKAEQVETFLDKDLLKIVTDAFGQVDDSRQSEFKATYQKAIEMAKEYGAADPEETEPVKKARAALDAVKDTVNAEGEIYDHLYRFFERYYDGGDFLSKRYYTRETSGKAAPFAVPYNGEEVKLHWANADQYYIKTTEYFTNFTFDLAAGAKLQIETNEKDKKQARLDFDGYSDMPDSLKVHFKIVDASEGEHGNVKASEATKRYFIIHNDKPVELNDAGELVCNFEYRPDPDKGSKQEGIWRQHRNDEAVSAILKALKETDRAKDYLRLLEVPAPTGSDRKRPLLAKYVNQYTARNTMDYFIHKDLGGFLARELDFYIKNEVMRLDDIEDADAPAVESYLAKIKVLRKIAGKLVEFLAQLEEFQKRLWLKKKFVTETNYCITLDRIISMNNEQLSMSLLEEIAANDDQRQEWVKLFAINEIKAGKGDLVEKAAVAYSEPLTVDYLKDNPYLVLDTRFFDDGFNDKLISSVENFDEQCDGLLIHSENFQALNGLQSRFAKQIKCAYIDPPYNSGDYDISYKNEYKHSSWLSLIENRVFLSKQLLCKNPVYFVAIDDYEMVPLCDMLDTLLPDFHREMVVINHHPQGGKATTLSNTHEYMIVLVKREDKITLVGRNFNEDEVNEIEERPFKRSGTAESNHRYGRPNSFYALLVDPQTKEIVGAEIPPEKNDTNYPLKDTNDGLKRIYPIGTGGVERVWRRSYESCKALIDDRKLICSNSGTVYQLIASHEKTAAFFSNWTDTRYNASTFGANLLKNIVGEANLFSYPKSINTLTDTIFSTADDSQYVLDYFAGSGTTGHAVIELNREDGGNRKYILVEMGDYFDTVLKPRIQKVVYSKDWKEGKPVAISNEQSSLNNEQFAANRFGGVSHCFKYIRLESYEDTLNNLVFEDNPARDRAITENDSLREDYMLGYMLDTETRGSQSLLNIDAFADPCGYQLTVKKPGTDEYQVRNVDLIETFNYLIGLRVEHIAAPQVFEASFKRETDPELPDDQNTRLVLDGRMKQIDNCSLPIDNCHWFRKIEGWVPADSSNPNNGQKERVLIVWRRLTGDLEKDNLMLDEWFQKNRISTRDFEFDTIYVNGSNNLPNLKKEGDNWKVRLIEEDFMKQMWNIEGI